MALPHPLTMRPASRTHLAQPLGPPRAATSKIAGMDTLWGFGGLPATLPANLTSCQSVVLEGLEVLTVASGHPTLHEEGDGGAGRGAETHQ